MKRSVLIILVILLLFSIVGCSSPSPTPTTAAPTTNNSVSSSEETTVNEDIDWPQKSVSIVVGANPGGGQDLAARLYAKYLEKYLGVSFPVVNVNGGGSSIASTQVKDSKPDGYTILSQHESVIANKLAGTVDYSFEAFEVAGANLYANAVVLVTNGNKFTNYAELVEYAKTHPGEVIACSETGTTGDQAFRALEDALGVGIQIADGGVGADRIVSVLGGHTDMLILPMGNVKDYVETGDFKVILFFSENKIETYPEYPTSVELGVDYTYDKFFSLSFPKTTDERIINKFSLALEQIAKDPEFIEEAATHDLTVNYLTPEETLNYMKNAEMKLITYTEKYSAE